ncbi:hypothetical protein HDU81_003674 [Chytriomyces hyalinus]|nr:hypothetical protein HDU81_003674 [Chytriomyces hyalinus]
MPEHDLPHPPEDEDEEQLEYDDDEEENEGDDEEARPLIASVQAPATAHQSPGYFPHTQALSPHLSLPLLVAVLAPLILAALHALVLQNASLPSRVISGEPDPRLFSGVDAWAHTTAMTENAHPHNSRDNDRVRAYIHSQAVRLQSIGLARGVSVEMADDSINMVTQDARVYYQSNNVLLRVNPFDHREHSVPSNSSKKALLVSSHFDTQVVANGVVDNAISVAVAIELVHSVLHASHLDHPLIINFNNGEELFLLGAGAFTLHPWFSQISAFINLDGTGSAPGTRSMLFRTNSIALTKEMKRYAPKPHASVLFNNLVSKVPSETDYRVYVGFGHLQGLDLAFYSYRYQYHTPDDSVEFSRPISAQHLGDNVLATVLGICNNPTLLESLNPVTPNLTQPILDPLPVPDFVYFDMFGAFMTVTSGRNFRLTIIWILIGCLVWAIGKSVTVSAKMGGRKFLVRYVRPTAEAFVCVLGGSIVVLGSVAILSACKSYFNQGSSYGMPIINLIWICAVVFGGLAGWVKVWPTVAEALQLRKKKNASATGRGRTAVLGQASAGVGIGQGRRAGGRRGRRLLNQSSSASPLLPSAYQVSMGPPLEKWLPYGLVAFWGTLLIPTMILSSYGYNGLFFLAHWGFYSLLAVGFTQLISPLALKWWRQGAAASLDLAQSPQSDQNASSVAWHNRVIRFYEKQIWGVQLALASVMPGFLTLDILGQLLISLPACIPGTPEIVNDLFFAALFVLLFANLLPAFQMSRKSYLAEAVLCVVALPFFASSLFTFPLSRIHPQQFSFEQLWNITTKTSAQFSSVDISFRYGLVTNQARVQKELEQIDSNVLCRSTMSSTKNQTEFKCTYPAIQPPSVNNSSPDPTALMKLSGDFTPVLVDAAKNVWDLRGEFEGVLGSRTCTLTVGHVNPRGDDYFVTYIDPPAHGEESEWQVEGGDGRRADPMQVEREETASGVPETVILRRKFGKKHGMRVPFWVRYSGGDVNTGRGIVSNLTVTCYLLEAERSEFYGRVKSEVPEWLMPGPGRYGGVKVFKTVQL